MEIIKRLVTMPKYFVLFSIYPVVFLFTENISQISDISVIIAPILLIFIVNFFLSSSLIIFFKDEKKVSFIVFSVWSLIYLYGTIMEIFERHNIIFIISNFIIAGKKVSFVVYLFVIFCLIIMFFKIKKYENISRILNILSMILIILPIVILITKSMVVLNIQKNEINRIQNQDIQKSINKKLPDIYYIILDAHTSFNNLRRFYNYDSEFEKYLTNSGFFIAENARSNYNITLTSIPSSMNMNYHKVEDSELKEKKYDKYLKSYNTNEVVKYLKNKGYYTVAIETENHLKKTGMRNVDIFNKYEDSGIMFYALILSKTIFRDYSIFFIINNYAAFINKNYKTLESFIELKTIQPKFVYMHIMSPHIPYIFNRTGKIQYRKENSKEGYLEQVIYTDIKIKECIQKIIQSNGDNIIILQGDHGVNQNGIENQFDCLNAFYPKNKIKGLYNSISPVNNFRIVFNEIFNEKYKVLKDESYFGTYEEPYKIKRIY